MSGPTIVVPMTNEGAFLPRWLARRQALGFDHIPVATNDCDAVARHRAKITELSTLPDCQALARVIATGQG